MNGWMDGWMVGCGSLHWKRCYTFSLTRHKQKDWIYMNELMDLKFDPWSFSIHMIFHSQQNKFMPWFSYHSVLPSSSMDRYIMIMSVKTFFFCFCAWGEGKGREGKGRVPLFFFLQVKKPTNLPNMFCIFIGKMLLGSRWWLARYIRKIVTWLLTIWQLRRTFTDALCHGIGLELMSTTCRLVGLSRLTWHDVCVMGIGFFLLIWINYFLSIWSFRSENWVSFSYRLLASSKKENRKVS